MPFDFEMVPDEVALASAPLVRVLAQIRYSPVPELVDDDTERVIAALLTDAYPVRGSVQGVALPIFGSSGPIPSPEVFRTFEDTQEVWKVTLAPEFVALETTQYKNRDDLIERLERLLVALSEVQRPPKVTRIGVRYTDRIEAPEGLARLVQPALLGTLPELADADALENQIVQAMLKTPEQGGRVQVRSLCLPPRVAFDPTIAPVPTQSWVLDIDSYNESSMVFDAEELSSVARTLAERAYQVFYWAVTEDFRELFGAANGGEGVNGRNA